MRWSIDVGKSNLFKFGERAGGDVFLSRRTEGEGRTVIVLSDGMGSGIKAGVLAAMTATMAARFTTGLGDIRHTAQIIMSTLPVCKVRRLSYATFTIVDIRNDGYTEIMEYDNPGVILVRNGGIIRPDREEIEVSGGIHPRRIPLYISRFSPDLDARIVLLSDGVTQSGMGTGALPRGWGEERVSEFVLSLVRENPEISSRKLARAVTARAERNDLGRPGDDTTCGIIHFRKPRKTLLVTGPPVNPAHDREMASMIDSFDGRTVVCGGTTANIIARELSRRIRVDISRTTPPLPPVSFIEGIDLVTEGILTLARTVELLENEETPKKSGDAAERLLGELMESDHIRIITGTKINEAHQDPDITVEIELRRNIVRKMVKLLREKYLKRVDLEYI